MEKLYFNINGQRVEFNVNWTRVAARLPLAQFDSAMCPKRIWGKYEGGVIVDISFDNQKPEGFERLPWWLKFYFHMGESSWKECFRKGNLEEFEALVKERMWLEPYYTVNHYDPSTEERILIHKIARILSYKMAKRLHRWEDKLTYYTPTKRVVMDLAGGDPCNRRGVAGEFLDERITRFYSMGNKLDQQKVALVADLVWDHTQIRNYYAFAKTKSIKNVVYDYRLKMVPFFKSIRRKARNFRQFRFMFAEAMLRQYGFEFEGVENRNLTKFASIMDAAPTMPIETVSFFLA